MATTAKIDNIRWSIKVSEQDINRIYNAVSRFTENTTKITIIYDDSIEIEKSSVEEAFEDSSNLGSDILRVSVRSRAVYVSGVETRSAYVALNKTNIINVVSGEFEGPTAQAIASRHEVTNILRSCRMWHSPIHYYDGAAFFTIIGLIGVTAILINYTLLGNLNINIVAGLVALTMPFYFGTYYILRSKMLPRMVFDIGMSSKKESFRLSLNKFIVYGVLFTLFMTVVGTYLTDWLKSLPK